MRRRIPGRTLQFGAMADRDELDPAAHRASVEAERARRNEGLRDPLSWLSLVGLHWLHPGRQSFGAAASNEIVLHAEGRPVPATAGVLELVDGHVLIHPADGALAIDGEPVPDGTELADDRERAPTVLELGSLRLHVLHRGRDRLALRVRDTEARALTAFQGVDAFDVDPAWRLRGRLIAAAPGSTIPVPDIVGDVNDEPTPGDVELAIGGHAWRLHALEAGPDRAWLVFGDGTNGAETYGGGRFLVTGVIEPDGSVEVDFNLAYNPPCVFSPYATCPMVPAGNALPIRIEAGERVAARPGAGSGDGETTPGVD
jgi:uncharacterized protein (DUF1684 family)